MTHIQISVLPSSFSFADKAFPFAVLHRDPVSQTGGGPGAGALCR
jgi:hypothetical protein